MHPIAVLETVTTDSRHVSFEDSLNKFRAAEKDIFGNNVEPPIINTDCGLNLLLSFLNVFLKEAWETHDTRVRAESITGTYTKSLIAWCKYHCIKSTKEWVYSEMTEVSAAPLTKKRWVDIIKCVEHHARVAKSVEAADGIMDDIIAVFSTKNINSESGMVRGGKLLIDIQLAEEPGSLEIKWVGVNDVVTHIALQQCDSEQDDAVGVMVSNPFYNTRLAKRAEWWKKYLVLWADAVVGHRPNKCNACAEIVNNVLKTNAFEGDKPARQDDYAIKRYKDFQGTLALYEENKLEMKRLKRSNAGSSGPVPAEAIPEVNGVSDLAEHDTEVPKESCAKGPKDVVELSQEVREISKRLLGAFKRVKMTWPQVVEVINDSYITESSDVKATLSLTRRFANQKYKLLKSNPNHVVLLDAYDRWSLSVDGDSDKAMPPDVNKQGESNAQNGIDDATTTMQASMATPMDDVVITSAHEPAAGGGGTSDADAATTIAAGEGISEHTIGIGFHSAEECAKAFGGIVIEDSLLVNNHFDVGAYLAFYENEPSLQDMLWYPVEVVDIDPPSGMVTIRYFKGHLSVDQANKETNKYKGDIEEMVYKIFIVKDVEEE
ncbi:hypothetical protein CYMTET_45381 [Cymbomonas tetramitiformis]|uniref:Uncharacterized protein n=1 Tax=Cymbomonas tetramitiformis TaxID=36881 RepID=A0AAE0EY33_9CHLO|nr:hypothetical protein CYMTET_45382 [Cymbomonas tetramitiformis]KAK3245032.1 hypothetical protein CYMTET_45381 [Cymbomonas tetramitiformis]